ncbi:MAG: proline--tRNA ligase [Deltaproteobacteria bacterium]|nr:proline--tRNA ligase [Deltaproteobacteria bacterium]
MKYSQSFIPTLRETPSDAEVISHKLMLRGGYIRKVAAGIYTYLPLGFKVLKKVENIVREEMTRAGAQEVLMPVVTPSELWQKSGRWNFYGKELLRIKDRHERDFCLGPTHEEVITELVGNEVRSYRSLPMNIYQIQTKFRDEVRPRFGLMRGREFVMKDAYSFHTTEEDAEMEYMNMYKTYKRIFERCGLKFRAVEADTGSIGGNFSHEFVVLAESGEDAVASCNRCEYAANVEKAVAKSKRYLPADREAALTIEKVSTPGKKTVEEVTGFMGVKAKKLVKTLIYLADGKAVVALVRGDNELNEVKFKNVLNCNDLELADNATVEKITKAPSGFAGPVGLKDVEIYADHALEGMDNFVTGGNEKDVHLKNVNLKDFEAKGFYDLRSVVRGDECPKCNGKLEIHRGIEVGHIFKLGTKYSEAMGATFLDADGTEKPMIMGCYGIGVGRTAAAAIEQNNDNFGIKWPMPLAPFQVIITAVNPRDEEVKKVAHDLYTELLDKGAEVLLDDRDERPGVKFKDADLLGIPIRLTIGARGLKEGVVEIKRRSEKDSENVPLKDAGNAVMKIISESK